MSTLIQCENLRCAIVWLVEQMSFQSFSER